MSNTVEDVNTLISRETLAGRLPVPGSARLYNSFGILLGAFIAIGAASFNYLFGASLAYIGNTQLAIAGWLLGLMLALGPIYLASGMISFKHGVDPVDAVKSSFGTRGSTLMLVMLLASTLGWSFVLVAMTGQAAGRLYQILFNPSGEVSNNIIALACIVMLSLIWLLLRKGPAMIPALTRITSPAVLIIAAVLLFLITRNVDFLTLLSTNVDPSESFTTDPLLQLAYGVEFGVSNALTIVPFFGGIARLIRKRSHLITPGLVGSGLLGAGCISAIGALAAIATGSTEPAEWVLKSAGNGFGCIIVVLLLLANVGTLISFIYLAGVSVQQIRFFAKLRWDIIILVLLLPGLLVAFNTSWLIDRVMTLLAYNGAIFAGIAGVMFSDYILLRRQRILPAHLFVKNSEGAYWFWGGVNWVAFAVVLIATGAYLSLFNPMTLEVSGLFRYIGAGMPAFAVAIISYYVLMRLVISSSTAGGYNNIDILAKKKVIVGL